MRLAVVSDVHGNLPALEAVLEEVERRGIRRIAYLGDLALLGLYPQECFDLLARYEPLVWIKGNADDDLRCVRDTPPANDFGRWLKSVADYAAARMSNDSIEYMDSLPVSRTLTIEGAEIAFCHGSPYNVSEKLDESLPPETVNRIAEEGYLRIFCGHTHIEKSFTIGSCTVTNFGAVGYSFDGKTGARFGIVESMEQGLLRCETVNIEYDVDGYMIQVNKENPPFKDNLLHALQHGRPPS